MLFSIIVPLGFHRGLAERCIEAWASRQSFPREQYEILLAAPETHDARQLSTLQGLLAAHDRIIRLPWQHDMPLVTEAAARARGEVLVFTESHCLPEADFLEQSAAILAERPGWAGFTGRSIPLTHNLLSEIEAGMYVQHIASNLGQHAWLKVLDQCFVIRHAAYRVSGGVEPQFGHFAEWVFAARLHHEGLTIGVDPRAAIHHHYVGDLEDLEEFTLDFAAGELRFARSAATDPCGDLFDEVPEWSDRLRWSSQVAGHFARLLAVDGLRHARDRKTRVPVATGRAAHWPWTSAWTWVGRRCVPESARLAWLRLQVRQLRLAVRWQLRQRDRARAEATFARLMSAWVHLGRRQLLASERAAEQRDELTVRGPGSEWLPDRRDGLPACGFHTLESWQGHRFRWSEPAAMLWLPPLEGACALRIEWAPFQDVDGPTAARFYLNERPIPPDSLVHQEHHTEITWTGSDPHGPRLSWVCAAVDSAGDERQLGLPVSRVSWSAGPEQQAEPTLYLLHVDKCA